MFTKGAVVSMTVAEFLREHGSASDIKYNKARHRREKIVSAGLKSDYAKAVASGDPKQIADAEKFLDTAEKLDRRAIYSSAVRLAQRKFRAAGRNADPNAELDLNKLLKAAKLRMDATDIGYRVRAGLSGGIYIDPDLIVKAKKLRAESDRLAAEAIGVPYKATKRPSLSREDKRHNERMTMAHYRKKAEEGDGSARRIVASYEANRGISQSLADAIRDYDNAVEKYLSQVTVGYTGASRSSTIGARVGSYKASRKTKQAAVAKIVMSKRRLASGAAKKYGPPVQTSGYRRHHSRPIGIEEKKKKVTESFKGRSKGPDASFIGREDPLRDGSRTSRGLRMGSATNQRLRRGSYITHLRVGKRSRSSQGYKRMHL